MASIRSRLLRAAWLWSRTAGSCRAARRSPCRSRGSSSRAASAASRAKLRQMVRAVQLERAFSKDEILSLYLSLAPYGGNLEGVRAASLSYFGKEPRRLSLAQSALLVALPQSPEARRPDRSPDIARTRARPRARPHGAGRPCPGRRNRERQDRDRAARAPADAGLRAACRRSGARGVAGPQSDPPHHRRAAAEESGSAGARTRPRARPGHFRRHRRGRQCLGRNPRARRLVGLFRRSARRAGGHVAGVALARLRAEALHLRPRLRGRPRASRNADRGPPDALRQLRAGEFRSDLPGHRHGAARACRCRSTCRRWRCSTRSAPAA